jgi:hypothetical protein
MPNKPIFGRKNMRLINRLKNKVVTNINNEVGKAGLAINSGVNQATIGANQLASKAAQNSNFPSIKSIIPKTFV